MLQKVAQTCKSAYFFVIEPTRGSHVEKQNTFITYSRIRFNSIRRNEPITVECFFYRKRCYNIEPGKPNGSGTISPTVRFIHT